jgi:hypothetical protein
MKWVILLALLLMLVACSKAPEPAAPAPEAPETPANTTPEAPAASPATGTAVFTVTDAAVKASTISSLVVEISGVEMHTAGNESDWVTVNSGATKFNLTQLKDTEQLLGAVNLAPAKYTQFRFTITDASAVVAGKTYEVIVPSGELKLVGVLDVVAGENATATIDFNLDQSLHLAGETAYLKPTIKLTTRSDADVKITNKSVVITGGKVETDEEHNASDVYDESQLNATTKKCVKECENSCDDVSDDCEDDCTDAITLGCGSEDEDFCREKCEPFMHPAICRDGCRESSSTKCTDYLQDYCASGCNSTVVSCNADCAKECEP